MENPFYGADSCETYKEENGGQISPGCPGYQEKTFPYVVIVPIIIFLILLIVFDTHRNRIKDRNK